MTPEQQEAHDELARLIPDAPRRSAAVHERARALLAAILATKGEPVERERAISCLRAAVYWSDESQRLGEGDLVSVIRQKLDADGNTRDAEPGE